MWSSANAGKKNPIISRQLQINNTLSHGSVSIWYSTPIHWIWEGPISKPETVSLTRVFTQYCRTSLSLRRGYIDERKAILMTERSENSPLHEPSISSYPTLQTHFPKGTSQSPSAPQNSLGVSLSSAWSIHAPLTSTSEEESTRGTVSGNEARFLSVNGHFL